MKRAPSAAPWFPVGLYGALVVATALAIFPQGSAAVESWLRVGVCLPLRALHVLGGTEAFASERRDATNLGSDAEADLDAIVRTGLEREAAAALMPDGSGMPAGLEPLACRVIERRVPGPAGLPSLLVLDRPWSDVEACVDIVTHHSSVVGFLGRAEDAVGTELAVVRCLHYRPRTAPPRRVLGAAAIGDGGPLRMVFEPASKIDAWPLRATLLDDPYRAALLHAGGHVVHTVAASPSSTSKLLPEGLRLGTLQVWGYAAGERNAVPVGFYLDPDYDPRAITSVVLWRPSRPSTGATRALPPPSARTRVHGVELPGGRRLHLLTGARRVPVGAAVVAGEHRLVGVVDSAGAGDATASVFGSDRTRWSFVLVPRVEGMMPIECSGRAVARVGRLVELEFDAVPVPVAGDLLTGGNGRHAPAGLYVGELRPLDAAGRRAVVMQRPFHVGELSACIGAEAGR